MRGVAPLRWLTIARRRHQFIAVQIAFAHVQRIQSKMAGNVANDHFDHDNALRAAKPPERRVALRIGFAAVGRNVHVLQKVGVVGVEDRAVSHRARQVSAEAAIHSHQQFQPGDAAAVVKTNAVVISKRVAFAGDHEVLVTVQPHFYRAPELVGCHCGPNCQMASLRFLAAKTAAHASAFDAHRMNVNPQCMRHPVLRFGRVLGA